MNDYDPKKKPNKLAKSSNEQREIDRNLIISSPVSNIKITFEEKIRKRAAQSPNPSPFSPTKSHLPTNNNSYRFVDDDDLPPMKSEVKKPHTNSISTTPTKPNNKLLLGDFDEDYESGSFKRRQEAKKNEDIKKNVEQKKRIEANKPTMNFDEYIAKNDHGKKKAESISSEEDDPFLKDLGTFSSFFFIASIFIFFHNSFRIFTGKN